MERFGDVPNEEINQEVKNSVPSNTVKTHNSIWKQFMSFCSEKKYVIDKNTTVSTLNLILKNWAWNMRKVNGVEYKEHCVKRMWNIVATKLQETFFVDYNTVFDPFHDIEFKTSRDARNAKRRTLQKQEDKRKTSSTSLKLDEYHKMVSLWDENTPSGLQRKFYLIASMELAWRGGEAFNCMMHYLKPEIDNDGIKTGTYVFLLIFSFLRFVFFN